MRLYTFFKLGLWSIGSSYISDKFLFCCTRFRTFQRQLTTKKTHRHLRQKLLEDCRRLHMDCKILYMNHKYPLFCTLQKLLVILKRLKCFSKFLLKIITQAFNSPFSGNKCPSVIDSWLKVQKYFYLLTTQSSL